MKKSFMTRVLATGLSLAMAFSLSAATNVSVASAAAKPAMKSSKMTVKVGQKKNYQATAATQKAYKITKVKMSAAGQTKAKVTVNSSKKSIKVEGLAATKGSNVVISFKNNKTKKTTKLTTKVVVKEEKLSVAGVTATNGTTLTVTGTKLGDLVAADITVVGNLVSSYTAAEDGKTATVKLAASLVPDEDTKVTIKGVDYTVKYSIKADTVAIKDATVDNDTKNQYLAITANGADSSVSDLVANGYTVLFESYKADGMTAYKLLDKDNDPNTTGDADVETSNTSGLIGKPANGLDFGTYKVRIILTKGTSVIKSDYATITVIDQDTLTTGINSVEGFLGANRTGATQVIKSTGDITLVIGEVLTIDKAEYVNAGKTYTSTSFTTTSTAISTSNTSVASATLADEKIKITASSVGNTTVTITFGKVSKAFNVKVVNVARKATSLVVKDAPAKVVSGCAATYKYYVVDNHGAYVYNQNVLAELSSGAGNVTLAAIKVASGRDGIVAFDITAKKAGTTVINYYMCDALGNKTSNLIRQTSLAVVTTDNKTNNFKTIAINSEQFVQTEAITTLDVNPLAARSKALNIQYTDYANGVVSGPAAIPAGATIKFDDRLVHVYSSDSKPTDTTTIASVSGSEVANNGDVSGDTWFVVEAKGTVTGTTYTDIVIRNAANTANLASIRVTVVDTKPYVTGGTLKMTSIDDTNLNVNLDNVLNIGADNSVSGINITNAPAGLKLYIDKTSGELYYNNSGAADAAARHYTIGYVKVATNSGNIAALGAVNALTRLYDGSTVNVVSSDSGTINVYVDTNQGGTTVGTTCTCIGSIVVK